MNVRHKKGWGFKADLLLVSLDSKSSGETYWAVPTKVPRGRSADEFG